MQTARAGTNRKIMERLRQHDALMRKYEAEGMTREEASKRAFKEVTDPGRPVPDHGSGPATFTGKSR